MKKIEMEEIESLERMLMAKKYVIKLMCPRKVGHLIKH